MKVGSLFSGIGGIDLAFERAGFDVAWQVEWNPDAQSVLRRHWPEIPLYGDITTVDPAELDPVDVMVFGSPCQDLSVAGKREGLGGAHSGLFFEAIRIIRAVRPSMALWENVPGAFSSNAGRDFAAVLAAFRDSGAREIGWRILDAQYCGVPQRRRRIFLVADFGGERASEILFEPESLRGNPPSRRKAGRVAPALLASGAGTSRPGGSGAELEFYVAEKSTCAVDVRKTANALTTRCFCDRGEDTNLIIEHDGVAHTLTAVAVDMRVRRLMPVETERLQGLPDDWTRYTAEGKELSDSARYRLVGNSVAVPAVEWIARRMARALVLFITKKGVDK